MIKKITFFIIFFVLAEKSHSQEITMEQTVTYINSKLGGSNTIDVVHGEIVATFLENGQPYREDQVAIQDLDSNEVKFISNQGLFVINCKATLKKCVTRNLFMLRETKTYGRISFPVNLNAASANGLKNAFLHMIRLVMIRKYESSTPFD